MRGSMEAAVAVPNDFKCPITLDIMADPVILPSGHTFDRSSIQRWLDAGHRTCPISKLPLPPNPVLIPNHALRSLISTFTTPSTSSSSPSSLTTTTTTSTSRVAAASTPATPSSLIGSLTSLSSPPHAHFDSLRALHALSKSNPAVRRQIADSGAVSTILRLVGSPDPPLQEAALLLLFNLSLDDDNKVGLVADGAVSRIVFVLRAGAPACRTIAATTLTSLAVVDVNKASIGDYPFAIDALVELLREGERRGKREAATAVYTLCSYPENQRKVVRAGAVPVLVELAGAGLERAVEVLALLTKCRLGRAQMEKVEGFAETMVGILRRGTPRSTVHALATLAWVCEESEKMRLAASREGAVDICKAMATDDNDKVRRKATRLIHVLRR